MIINISRCFIYLLLTTIVFLQNSLQNNVRRKYKVVKTCKFDNTEYKNVLELLCIQCHELFSYSSPNLRAQCRTNCFDNSTFMKCLEIFEHHNTKRSLYN